MYRLYPIVNDAVPQVCFSESLPRKQIEVDGVKFTTGPLLPGVHLDILGVSTNEEMIEKGSADHTDSIYDLDASVETLYLQWSADPGNIVAFYAVAPFHKSTEGNPRELSVDCKVGVLLDGKKLPLLVRSLGEGRLVNYHFDLKASLNTETGHVIVRAGSPTLVVLHDEMGEITELKIPDNVREVLGAVSVIGYDLRLFRTNANRRTVQTAVAPAPPVVHRPAHILMHFSYQHLPAHLQEFSKPFHDLAVAMDESLPICDETAEGLRKLMEAKDCFVRARREKEVCPKDNLPGDARPVFVCSTGMIHGPR